MVEPEVPLKKKDQLALDMVLCEEEETHNKGCQLLGKRLLSAGCKKHTIVANSTTEAEYVVAANCYGQVKTINEERQIQALVDKKKVIISETSIRSDLKLDVAEGTDCLPTATIFAELEIIGHYHSTIILKPSKKSRRKQRKDSALTEPTTEETTLEKHVSTPSYDPPLSGEDRMQLAELMSLCTNLQEKVLNLEKAKTAQAKEITSLKKRVN
ncbi:hypothetical protein Tco_0204950 [Tanacetum coccineum]